MRVFVTGASGWIGSAVVPELINAGHEVVGLARSDAAAAKIDAAGARALRGTIDDLDLLKSAATDADAVVHLAFKHDQAFSGDFDSAVDADQIAVDAFGEALAGTGKPFTIASGTLHTEPGEVSTELDDLDLSTVDGGIVRRVANAQRVIALAERGVRSSVVRLPPTVHGEGDPGFVAALVAVARDKGVSGYIGDGSLLWSAVHRSDAASLFRLAIEEAPAGTNLHGVDDEGVSLRAIAEVVGRHLELPTVAVPVEDAAAHFGWLSAFFGKGRAASSMITRALLGWKPTGPGLIEDLEQGHYFAAPAA